MAPIFQIKDRNGVSLMPKRSLPSPVEKTIESGSFDPEMDSILREMLSADEDISARAVIRRHSKLKAASSITRSRERTALLDQYKERQEEFRGWRHRLARKSKDASAMDMAEKDIRIAELESQVEILTASHVAMIRAVGEMGGFSIWARFFDDYRGIRDQLRQMKAIPTAPVTKGSF